MKKSKTNKNSRAIIDEYYNETFRVKLAVANMHATLKQLQKRYIFPSGKELNDDILQGCATASCCYDIKTNEDVILVKHNAYTDNKRRDKKAAFIEVMAHEATHVALDIYDLISQQLCFNSPEPFCYLVGWATECIYKTWTKKAK